MQISREPTVWRSYLRLHSFVDLSWQGLWYSAFDLTGFDRVTQSSTLCTSAPAGVCVGALGRHHIDGYWAILQPTEHGTEPGELVGPQV
jgi:hypothetical protein